MKKIILLAVVALCSCKHKIPVKPFIVIGKTSDYLGIKEYEMIDKKGYVFTVREEYERFVGDTIK